jgi:hypothetical protein
MRKRIKYIRPGDVGSGISAPLIYLASNALKIFPDIHIAD